jgi:hypothetical protein
MIGKIPIRPHKDFGPTKTREKIIRPRTTRITLSTLWMFCFMAVPPVVSCVFIKYIFQDKCCSGFEKMKLSRKGNFG